MPDGGEIAVRRHVLLTVPNAISFARLCAVPLAIWLVLDRRFAPATGIFAAAGISDAIDGWLARREGGTVLGAALDPLADKSLMVGMYVTLAAIGVLPTWLAILVVFRDILIVGGILLLWVTGHTLVMDPLPISKVNTGVQIGLVGLVLALAALHMEVWALRWGMIGLTAITTFWSGAAYVRRAVRPA
jgi:cardiolipin synthase